MGALLHEIDDGDAEAHRKDLLAEADRLLDRVEHLRLMEQEVVPPALAASIRALQARLGGLDRAGPRTVRAAQHQLFAVQHRLMAANPRNPRPRPHAGRAAGVPRVRRLGGLGAWKFLALPPARPVGGEEWRRLTELTVDRARDRWCYAQGMAVSAARAGRPDAATRVSLARMAWSNFWDLRCEADRLLNAAEPTRLAA